MALILTRCGAFPGAPKCAAGMQFSWTTEPVDSFATALAGRVSTAADPSEVLEGPPRFRSRPRMSPERGR